jgi:hypothetical protein
MSRGQLEAHHDCVSRKQHGAFRHSSSYKSLIRNLLPQTCGLDISVAHSPFRVVSNASQPANRYFAESVNMFLALPPQLMGRSREFVLFTPHRVRARRRSSLLRLARTTSREWLLYTACCMCVRSGCPPCCASLGDSRTSSRIRIRGYLSIGRYSWGSCGRFRRHA